MDDSGLSRSGRSSHQASTDNGPADRNLVVSPLERLAEHSGTRNLALLSDERFIRRQGRDPSTLMDSSADTLPRLASVGGRSEVRAFSRAEGREKIFEKQDKQEFYMHHTISADRSGTNDDVKTSILSVLGAREREPDSGNPSSANGATEEDLPLSSSEVEDSDDYLSDDYECDEIWDSMGMGKGSELNGDRKLALAIMDFLNKTRKDHMSFTALYAENISTAIDHIGLAFNVRLGDKKAMKQAVGTQPLLELYATHHRGLQDEDRETRKN